ncbi:MAG TPA: hypothetical protein VEO95_10935 [Chthoniobacteraceae bacterium]|nr:hypothetical protein [Chthoniobacteraceae bacterium]
MAEPTVEWGKQLVEQVRRIQEHIQTLLTFRTVVLTIGGCIGSVIVGLTTWILLGVTGLQTSVAVLDSNEKSTADDVKRISEEAKRDRDTTEKFRTSVTRLETIVERLERVASAQPRISQPQDGPLPSKPQ